MERFDFVGGLIGRFIAEENSILPVLPPEILEKILAKLDFESIGSARQTCKLCVGVLNEECTRLNTKHNSLLIKYKLHT